MRRVGCSLHLGVGVVVRSEDLAIQVGVLVHGHRALGALLHVLHLQALHAGAAVQDGALQAEAGDGVLGAVVFPVAQEAGPVAFQRDEVPAPDEVHVVDQAASDGVRAPRAGRMMDIGEGEDVLVGYDVGRLAAHARAVPIHEVARHEGVGHLPFFANLVAIKDGHAAEHALEPFGAQGAGLRAAPLIHPRVHFLDWCIDGDAEGRGFDQVRIETLHQFIARVRKRLLGRCGVEFRAPVVHDAATGQHPGGSHSEGASDLECSGQQRFLSRHSSPFLPVR